MRLLIASFGILDSGDASDSELSIPVHSVIIFVWIKEKEKGEEANGKRERAGISLTGKHFIMT